ncbi:MAG: LexA family transcriptional regulator [Desulfohalobiaceae bacterium]|nr:LexA family transcriptional regulator [Desulfohalobiaceae bacterium]
MSQSEQQKTTTGFASAGEDFRNRRLDLNELLVRRPASTFFLRAAEETDLCGGVRAGDLLVVDRALEPDLGAGSLVVVRSGGEMLLRLLLRRGGLLWLYSGASRAAEARSETDLRIFGVVTNVLHPLDSR